MRALREPLLLLIAVWVSLQYVQAGIPAKAHYYPHQLVDHVHTESPYHKRHWVQRYYMYNDHFAGPGHPILVIMGGEGAMSDEVGLYYPFVVQDLAAAWGALVIQPEHRFYGTSQPITHQEIDVTKKHGLPDPRGTLLTTEQALYDVIRLLHESVAPSVQCSLDPFSRQYCPVVAIGGSYPGFLAAMARFRFPHVFDMAYAASAPMHFYDQTVNENDYYNHITQVAERAYPGCSAAVKRALQDLAEYYQPTLFNDHGDDLAINTTVLGLCPDSLPSYIGTNRTLFVEEINMVLGYTFANLNMAYYPPTNTSRLYHSCEIFMTATNNSMASSNNHVHPRDSDSATSLQQIRDFFIYNLQSKKLVVHGNQSSDIANVVNEDACWNMKNELPSGDHATISSGDWSGVGSQGSGESWDFQTCTLLVEHISFGRDSMFLERPFTLDWLTHHCQTRFGLQPQPYQLVHDWHFDDLIHQGASRILFTNGLNDGWSVGGIQTNLSDTVVALNFPNGAHHSDLNGHYTPEDDTPDIQQGYRLVRTILSEWLADLASERML
jgi:hypothetical protein